MISWATSWRGLPLTADLNLRGRLASDGSPTKRRTISWIAGVPSMISSTAMPASGEPSTTRGVSPHASAVDSPTASSRCQISGTSSIRIQWCWTFWRSVMSAVPRPKSCATDAMARSWATDSWPPSMRTRSMKYSSSSSSGSSTAVRPPSMPGRRWVYRPHQRIRPRRSLGSIEAKPRWA